MELRADNLATLPEWQMIVETLKGYMRDYVDDILVYAEKNEVGGMAERAGRIAMIKEMLAFPENLFGGHGDAIDQKGQHNNGRNDKPVWR